MLEKRKVRYSYLSQQFSDCDDLWDTLKNFVSTGDFTLGQELLNFEKNFADVIGSRFAIGVNSGTDAIKLSLKAIGVMPGDEVITSANTFVATVGAINELGAKPVFVDCNNTFCLDVTQIERSITNKTKAIVPVHFSGYMVDMPNLIKISDKYNLPVVEDACQSILANINDKNAGTWGTTGAFSLHPLKNLNIWADGGVVVTDEEFIYKQLLLLRNHGLKNRDEVQILGYNSRLDTFQAVVANWLLPKVHEITNKRIQNAKFLDLHLSQIPQISIPIRRNNEKVVYHLYMVRAKNRNNLLKFLNENNIEAKVHYPIPMYRQQAVNFLNNKIGDFPNTDNDSENLISFPCDQHLEKEQLLQIVEMVKEFYSNE